MEDDKKLTVLRGYETYCYSTCFFILKNETQSIEAAQKILIDIFYSESFYNVSSKEQLKIIRMAAVKHSLKLLIQHKGA